MIIKDTVILCFAYKRAYHLRKVLQALSKNPGIIALTNNNIH